MLSKFFSLSTEVCAQQDGSVQALENENTIFVGVDGATSLKAEIVGRIPKIADASKYREARHLLQQLGGWTALKDELCFSGFVDHETGKLTTNDKPFNVFAQFAAGKMTQPSLAHEQEALGEYKNKYLICANRPDNDLHWDSTDPKWISKASMARRHRFLTTKDLHWQWFNVLSIGLVPAEEGGVDARNALAEVERIRAAALHFAKNVGGWSDQVGLYVNVFGHNNVNSLFVHVLDMTELGPGFSFQNFKNCPLDAVIKVLREDAATNLAATPPPTLASTIPALRGVAAMRRKSTGKAIPFFFAGTDGATSLKAELIGRVPVMKDAASFREARRLLVEELGGTRTLRQELVRFGFVDEDTNELTTGMNPFNVFARISGGQMKQPGMEKEQEALGKYKEFFMVCSNRPENDEHWDSEDPEWVGKASMSRRHRFLTVKDLHFQWFNALIVGLVDEKYGGAPLAMALEKLEIMKAAALTYAANIGNYSNKVGLFFHVFGHNTVNSLHMHVLDMTELGPTFWKYEYKNCPVDAILKVLREEVTHKVGGGGALAEVTQAATAAAQSLNEAAKVIVEASSRKTRPSSTESANNHREILTLNVSGEVLCVTRSTLLICPPGSLICEQFSTAWDAPRLDRDSEGRIYLNYPPRAFKAIIDHLRLLHLAPTNQLLPPPVIPADLRREFRDLCWLLGLEAFLSGPQWGCQKGDPRRLQKRVSRWGCLRRRPPPRLLDPALQASQKDGDGEFEAQMDSL